MINKQINFNIDEAEFRKLQQLVNKDEDLNDEEIKGKSYQVSLFSEFEKLKEEMNQPKLKQISINQLFALE